MKKIILFFITFFTFYSCNSTNCISKNNEIFNLNQSLEEIIQTENTEIFRLISEVEMSGSSDILVIENKNDVNSVYYLEKEFKKIKTSKITISKEKYEKLIKELKELNFENLEGYKENAVDDGIKYRFQYYYNGKYNVITRNNPQTGKGFDAVFLQITNLMYYLKK
ncbi:MAG: hypothetical protein KUL74_04030 [Cloacibacterium sp.]|nr:hypothetical protein [Cloacibacterium sp.]